MDVNLTIEASQMLAFLKKEEEFYEKTLENMKNELMRLEIEEMSLKAMIRREELIVKQQNASSQGSLVKENTTLPSSKSDPMKSPSNHPKNPLVMQEDAACSSSNLQDAQNTSSLTSPSVPDSVVSSVNDERHLEPLFLNPNDYHNDDFMMFDY